MDGRLRLRQPDLIARDEFGDWNSEGPVLAAARRAEEIREACLRESRSLAFETVLSADDKIDFLHRARAAGSSSDCSSSTPTTPRSTPDESRYG